MVGKKGASSSAPESKHDALEDWARLDTRSEENFMQSTVETAQLEALLRMKPGASNRHREQSKQRWQSELQRPPDETYQGLRFTVPLTEDSLHEIYNHIKTEPDNTIHAYYMALLLLEMKKLVLGLPRVTELTQTDGPHERLVVVGDLHGQLQDFLCIIEKHGFPGPGRAMYLFNGDFVDRGAYGVEIVILLFVFKLVYPDSVHLNRGNHEDALINQRYGFCDEVIEKFSSLHMFSEFQEIWNLLPIATTIDGLAMIVHGGLFRLDGVLLKHLRSLPRVACNLQPKTTQETIMVDLLWSDPSDEPGQQLGVRGGNTIRFGADVTHRFLAQNKLKMLIRSHEVPTSNKGFDVTHNGRLVTVFSASNYCGHRGNSGAVMVFQRDLKYTFHEHWAPPLESFCLQRTVSMKKPDIEKQAEAARIDVIRQVKKLVVENKTDLCWFWAREDAENHGAIPLETWRQGMNVVLHLMLPWEKYEDALIKKCMTPSGDVQYNKFLDQFQVRVKPEYAKWKAHVTKQVHDALVHADLNLTDMVGVFDQNNDGFVDVDELSRVFARLEIDVTRDQIQELLADVVIGGRVDVFSLIESLQTKNEVVASAEVKELLDWLSELLLGNVKHTIELFESIDKNGDGRLQHDEFLAVVRKVLAEEAEKGSKRVVTEEMLIEVLKVIDINMSGSIDYMEFVDVFHRPMSSMDRLLEQICRVFYKYQDSLCRAFQYMDVNGDGMLTPEEFADGLSTFNALVAEPLSGNTMEAVVRYIDRNSDGFISYQEFCSAFFFVDNTSDTITTSAFERHRRTSQVRKESTVSVQFPAKFRSLSP